VFFITLSSSGISIIWDKKLGTLERAQVAGVKTYEVLLAFLLSEGSVLVIQTSLSYLVMRYVLGIEVKGSVFLLLSLIFLVGLSGLSMGI
jgi:ABC-2 type transport system permease protein